MPAPHEPQPQPQPYLPLEPRRVAYVLHWVLYGGRHNNPAKCLRKCEEPEPCGHVHPCIAVN